MSIALLWQLVSAPLVLYTKGHGTDIIPFKPDVSPSWLVGVFSYISLTSRTSVSFNNPWYFHQYRYLPLCNPLPHSRLSHLYINYTTVINLTSKGIHGDRRYMHIHWEEKCMCRPCAFSLVSAGRQLFLQGGPIATCRLLPSWPSLSHVIVHVPSNFVPSTLACCFVRKSNDSKENAQVSPLKI
jgi:hypothetical protein